MGGFRGIEINPIRVKSWQKVLLENGFDLREYEEAALPHGNQDRSRSYLIKADGIEIHMLEDLNPATGKFSVVFVTWEKAARPIVERLIKLLEQHCT